MLCAFFGKYVSAQVRSCGTMPNLQMLLQQDPQTASRMDQIEQFTQHWVSDHPQGEHSRAVYTIPVVVHVVYNTATENISDAQIHSQIAVLNKDFSRTNTDAGNTPVVWRNIAANSGIQFCLATKDPNGLPTTGITRTATSVTAFTENNNVKRTANGGKDPWSRDKYLNIWVCDLSGIIGYAQFPGGPAATDGVVIDYKAFGTTGTASVPFHLGRTATHEIGHWLNLRHIWGDDASACTGSDLVGDTPNQADENYGCPVFPSISCSNTPNGDMFMNYMDYSNDACMNLFTNGQKARMQALFAVGGARFSLLSSTGCSSSTTVPVVSCNVPTGLYASNITTTGVKMNWSAVSGATAYSVRFKASASSLWVTSNGTTNSFTVNSLTAGTQYEFQVKTTCGTQSSAYSASAVFTTTSSGCTDNYEPNETRGTAKPFPSNLTIQAPIRSSTDVDWYRIGTTSSKRNMKITLTNLPANYNIALYSSNGTLLRQSISTGTTNETIRYNNGALATYYIQVYGNAGAYNTTTCYNLNVQLSSSAFRTAKQFARDTEEVDESEEDFIQRIYPNPAAEYLVVDFASEAETALRCNVYDLSGKVVLSQDNISAGDSQFILNTGMLQTGIYFLHVNDGKRTHVKRFLVER